MGLDSSALKGKLVSAMNGIDDPTKAYTTFAKTVGEYIQQNAVVSFSWAGAVLPPPASTPDPTASFKGKITGATVINQPSSFEVFALEMDMMITKFQIMPPTEATPPSVFSLAPPSTTFLGSLGLTIGAMGEVDSFDGAMDKIATQIVTGIKKMINPTPQMGTHTTSAGVFAGGTAIMTSIA